jgi:hypothetical protein
MDLFGFGRAVASEVPDDGPGVNQKYEGGEPDSDGHRHLRRDKTALKLLGSVAVGAPQYRQKEQPNTVLHEKEGKPGIVLDRADGVSRSLEQYRNPHGAERDKDELGKGDDLKHGLVASF